MRYYILRNQVVVLASSAKEFGEWVETADRVVSQTQVADIEVSTGYCQFNSRLAAWRDETHNTNLPTPPLFL